MSRRFPSLRTISLTIVLTLAFLGLQALVPVCAGARAAAFAKHDCCAGQKSCHTQWRRGSCCEVQPGAEGLPPTSLAKHQDSGKTAPATLAVLPILVSIPKLAFEGRELARRAQAPPLYLTKQSLLC
ncbi:hypothetical protein FBR05_07210 [Deltaproteobacteria bacterium PRO3]|nr:hypothetical protein [Deltaproteobacteria bacterium PRO3]